MAWSWWRRLDPYAIVQQLQAQYGRRVSNRLKRVLKVLVLGLVVMIVGSGLGVQVTSKARFCVTCHYMRPYYDSWKASKHNNVECVDCHFPPGLESELRRKFEASVQIVKYVTKQYGTRPWTQIDDRSCLRSGCHVKHQLPKKQVREGMSFDHLPHLTQFRRVTRLRCTSCHSQIVQGSHMVATLSTCFLCHFKDTSPGTGRLSNCTTCHKLPIKSQAFDHQMANERRVSCLSCHGDVIQGDGTVPRERCSTCHSEPERLQKYDDVEFMHLNHVTNHKVDCMRCHDEIRHKLPRHEVTGELSCSVCHPNQHAATRQLYAGVAPDAQGGQPDPMYEARVACGSCHLQHQKLPDGSDVYTAGLAGCANCHGEEFGPRLAKDRSEIAGLLAQARPAVTRARGIIRSVSNKTRRDKALELTDSADRMVTLVERGGGVHNPSLARRLLHSAAQNINDAMVAAGASYRLQLVTVAKFLGMPDKCLSCHTQGYPQETKRLYGVDFSHERHVDKGRVACAACHDVSQAGSGPHGQLKVQSRDACRACHEQRLSRSPHPVNWRKAHGLRAKLSAQDCTICHSTSRCDSCHKLPMPHPSRWVLSHGTVARQRPTTCNTCHPRQECLDCHRKHPPANHVQSTWPKQHGVKADNRLCALCHGRNACTTCHGGVALPHTDAFKMGGHGPTVQRQPQTCVKCHDRSTKFCLGCHEGLAPSNHEQKSWRTGHGQGANTALCERCHSKPVCSSCHSQLTKSPHPDDWAMEHKAQARFERKAKCFLCHKLDYCQQCHEGAVLN